MNISYLFLDLDYYSVLALDYHWKSHGTNTFIFPCRKLRYSLISVRECHEAWLEDIVCISIIEIEPADWPVTTGGWVLAVVIIVSTYLIRLEMIATVLSTAPLNYYSHRPRQTSCPPINKKFTHQLCIIRDCVLCFVFPKINREWECSFESEFKVRLQGLCLYKLLSHCKLDWKTTRKERWSSLSTWEVRRPSNVIRWGKVQLSITDN